MPNPLDTLTVMLHGFITLTDGSPEHVDYDDPECTQWNVWVRLDYHIPFPPNFEPFTSVDPLDRDFESYQDAVRYAVRLSHALDAEVDEY